MKRNISTAILVSFLGGIVGRGFRYGLTFVVASMLGAEALGLFTFGLVIIKAGALIARTGLDNAAQKYIPIYQNEGDHRRLAGVTWLCLTVPFILGSIVAVLIHTGSGFIDRYVASSFGETTKLFLSGIPLFAMMMVGISATKGFKRTKYAVYIRDFGQSGFALIGTVVILSFEPTVSAVIFVYLLSLAVGAGLTIVFILRDGTLFPDESPIFEMKKVLGFSLPLLLVTVSQYVVGWADVLMLGLLTTAREVGYYHIAFQTSMLLGFILMSANSIFPAIVADLYYNDEHTQLEQLYTVVTKWITYFTLLGYVFVIAYRNEILRIFGAEFVVASHILMILGAAQVVASVTGPSGYLLRMSGNERLEPLNAGAAALLNIVLNFILIKEHGTLGAAIATTISLSVINLARVFQGWMFADLHPYSSEYWKGLGIILLITPLVFFIQPRLSGGIIEIFVVGIGTLVTFSIAMLIIGFDESDRHLLQSLD